MRKEKQIEEMAQVLKDCTKKNNIMASHVILENYAEELYNAGYRKQIEGEWISVDERLPNENFDWVLVACQLIPEGGYSIPHIAELRHGVWYADCYDIPLENAGVKVTHWMPLPEPPKMKGEQA